MMAHESILYKGIFAMLTGFLTFAAAVINKINMFFAIMDSYFILFIFCSIVITVFGLGFLVVWNFKNMRPYFDSLQPQEHFMPYVALGAFTLIVSLMIRFYFDTEHLLAFIAPASIGIILLAIGLNYFIHEDMARKTPLHS